MNKDEVKFDEINFSNLNLQEKKENLYKYYDNCFGNGNTDRDNTKYYYLAILKDEVERGLVSERLNKQKNGFVAQNVIEIHELIYKKKYDSKSFDPKVRKNKKYEIKRNLNGVVRFLEFSKYLRGGVFTLSAIPMTYFVKISVDDWKEFC